MTQQTINVGTAPNSGNGDPSRTAFTKTNSNFTDLYTYAYNYIGTGTGAVTRTTASKLTDIVSVKDYGATGNGTTDDTISIQAALNSGAGALLLNPGTYKVSSLTIPSGVTLVGFGAYQSVLQSNSATLTTIAMNTSSCIKDLKVLTSVTKTAGFFVDVQGNGSVIDNCEFSSYYIAINVGTAGSAQPVGTLITDCEFRTPAVSSGSGAIQFTNFSNANVRNCIITGAVGTQADFGIKFRNGDTGFLTNTNITLHGKALLIDTLVSTNVYAITIDSCVFDSAGTITGGSTVSSAEIIPAGGVYNTRFSNCWFGLSASKMGCYMAPSGAGVIDGITFTGCEFTDNGDCGLIAVGTGVKNWIVTGGHAGGNTNYGVRAASGTSNFTITGMMCGNIAGRGANNYGIVIDAAASDNYLIADNNVVGNTSAGIYDQGTGTNAQVYQNLGYNGLGNVAGVTVGASPWSYTAAHTPESLYILGGTVSAITIDGNVIQNATGATVNLVPNETMQITYTVTPTVLKKKT